MAEGDVLEDAFAAVPVVDVAEVARLDVEVLKGDAADVGAAAPLLPGADGVHRRPGAVDADVAEGRVADFAVAHTETDGVAAGGEAAVADANVGAGARRAEARHVGAQRDGVVGRVDVAVRDLDVLAAVDVDAVAVVRVEGAADRADGEPAGRDANAAVEEARPVRGVLQRQPLDTDVLRLHEVEHLSRTPRDGALSARPRLAGGRVEEEGRSVAVDAPFAAHGDVRLADAEEQVRAGIALRLARPVLRADVGGVVVGMVRAGLQDGVGTDMERDMAFEVERAAEEGAVLEPDLAPAGAGGGVDGALDGGGVLGRAVAHGAEVAHAEDGGGRSRRALRFDARQRGEKCGDAGDERIFHAGISEAL